MNDATVHPQVRQDLHLRVVDGPSRDLTLSITDPDVSFLSLSGPLGIDTAGIERVLVDGREVDVFAGIGELRITDGSVVAVERRGEPSTAVDAGRLRSGPFLRPARFGDRGDATPLAVPAPPKPHSDRPAFPWIMALAPLPVGAVMALLMGPRMAVFALLGPLMVGARFVESGRAHRRDVRRFETEKLEVETRFVGDLVEALETRVGHLRRIHPSPDTLVERIDEGLGLWERRATVPAALVLRIGVGDVAWRPPLADGARLGELQDRYDGHQRLPDAPVTVDLAAGPLGIAGPRPAVEMLARAVVGSVATHLGPADIDIALAGSIDHSLWDPLKWLPHAVEASELPVVVGPRLRLAVVDGTEGLRRSGALLDGAPERAAVLVLAERAEDLPAECDSVVQLGIERHGVVTSAAGSATFVADVLSADGLDAITRRLASTEDPELAHAGGVLPDRVTMTELHGAADPHRLQRRWRRATPDALRAVVGVGASGPARLDLVADGPHVLAAGTTGAGKSEWLRALVLSLACHQSPDECNFILVDYKGGGAFDACADLPHTAAVVTDLDDHLARRAMRGLRAELRRREEELRDAGASDLVEFRRQGGAMARLVIVVDEFATLAAELPAFLDSLVDVAQRGRSLGLHLVLATQRPAGVLDGKIRANTNLRVSLRVQDANDSIDVIGVDDACRLDRRRSGRGFVRFGDGQIEPFQSAYSGSAVGFADDAATARPFRLVLGADDAHLDDPWRSVAVTELEAFVARLQLAADGAGCAPARPLWSTPLPASLTLDDALGGLATGEGASATGPSFGTLGLVDDPDRQRILPLGHDPRQGSLLVVGADAGTTSSTVLAVVRAAASELAPGELHLHRLGPAGDRCSWLGALPHHGASVEIDDLGSVERLVELLEDELAARRRDPECRSVAVVVAADGLGALFEALGEAGERDLLGRLNALLRDGPPLGVTWVAAARTLRSLPSLVRNALATVWVHRLAEMADYAAFGLRERDLPSLDGNALVVVDDGRIGVVADVEPLLDGRPVPVPAPGTIRSVGPVVARSEVELAGSVAGRRLILPIGLDADRARPVALELDDVAPALVLGRSGRGRTTLLDRLAAEARGLGVDVVIPAAGERPPATAEGPTLVLVDDIDRWADDDLDWLGARRSSDAAPCWVVASAQPGAMRRTMSPLRALRGTVQGFSLGFDDDLGDLFGVAFPKRRPEPPVTGRGWRISPTGIAPTQIAAE